MINPYINTNTLEYPLTFTALKKRHPDVSIPAGAPVFTAGSSTYAKVTPTTAPDCSRHFEDCTEALPALVDGVWTQQWAAIEVDIETAVTRLKMDVDAERDTRLAGGFKWDFGGSLGVLTLSSGKPNDITNWLSVTASAQSKPAATVMPPIITEENVPVTMTAAETITLFDAMRAYFSQLHITGRAKKDEVLAAADIPALRALDLTSGWPTNNG